MATSYLDIYTRAMSELKDPNLSRLQANDFQTFCIIMDQYLSTALTFYNPNKKVENRLSSQTPSTFGDNSFVGDGVTTSFVLTGDVPITSDSIFKVEVGEEVSVSYTIENETITFETAPSVGTNIYVSWYNNGQFDGDLIPEDVTLLSLALCWAWAIQTQNNRLDIDRSLTDTDFKQSAVGNALNARVNWVKHFEEMFHREQSKADWRTKFRIK